MNMLVSLQIMNINESPVFLLLDDNISVKHKNLPVNLYESGEGLITQCHNLYFKIALLYAESSRL